MTPSPQLLEEIWHRSDADVPDLSGRTCVTRSIAPLDQAQTCLLAAHSPLQADSLEAEETLVSMLRGVVRRRGGKAARVTSRSLALVASVKELLATTGDSLSLTQIASSIGASPAYLTDLFNRIEGVPIYRYQMRRRLSRALGLLPHVESLTELALDLGFSSHSHFSSVFRATFGMTPSAYRDVARRRKRRDALDLA